MSEEPIDYEFYSAVCDERDRLREALTFYARPLSWVTETAADQGEIAREALAILDDIPRSADLEVADA